MPSRAEWPTEAPCIDCGKRTPGLLIGNRCDMCRVERERRASRQAGRISLVAAGLVAAWLVWRPIPGGTTGRIWAGVAVLVSYLLVRRIAARVLFETMPAGREDVKT
jgi:hypothetical protein